MDHRPAPVTLAESLATRLLPDDTTWLDIAFSAARAEGIPLDVMLTRSRAQGPARARQRAWYALRHHPLVKLSLPDIATTWGYDHTTVMAGINSHAARLALRTFVAT